MAILNPLTVSANLERRTQQQSVLRGGPSSSRPPSLASCAFVPKEIMCIIFGLLFVLDHKVVPEKARRRFHAPKKREATDAAPASGPSTLHAGRPAL